MFSFFQLKRRTLFFINVVESRYLSNKCNLIFISKTLVKMTKPIILTNPHNNISGQKPVGLQDGQIAINNADETIYIKGKDGNAVGIYMKQALVPETFNITTATTANTDGIIVVTIAKEETREVILNVSVNHAKIQIVAQHNPPLDLWIRNTSGESIVVNLVDWGSLQTAVVHAYAIIADGVKLAHFIPGSTSQRSQYTNFDALYAGSELTKPADVWFCKASGETFNWRKVEGKTSAINAATQDGYTPVGVEVIPRGFYYNRDYSRTLRFNEEETTKLDGITFLTPRPIMMSLKPMSLDTPASGGDAETAIGWGANTTGDIKAMPRRSTTSVVPLMGKGYYMDKDLPFTAYSNAETHIDSLYALNKDNPNLLAQNFNYGHNDAEDSAALDFDGDMHSIRLWQISANKQLLDTATSLNGNLKAGVNLAAVACGFYTTVGTKKLDWYLPAFGELMHIVPFAQRINKALEALGTTVATPLDITSGTHYTSSTELSENYAIGLRLSDGSVRPMRKDGDNGFVRAFRPVGNLPEDTLTSNEGKVVNRAMQEVI